MIWLRLRARPVAVALLAMMATLGTAVYVPHAADCHDPDCGFIVVAHDASAHRLIANPSGAKNQPLHCLACHWARSFRPRTESRVLPTPAPESGTTVHVEFFTAAASAPVAQPPLRSPPVPALSLS
jgi:hypothetical protein